MDVRPCKINVLFQVENLSRLDVEKNYKRGNKGSFFLCFCQISGKTIVYNDLNQNIYVKVKRSHVLSCHLL